MTWVTSSTSSENTARLGEQLGAKIRGGEVIELVSDLGGGKTTFTRGLVRGAGSPDPVSSPTFTLRNEYHAKDLTIYHFDFYRLNEAGIMSDELAEVIGDQVGVAVIEWGEIVADILPTERLSIKLTAIGENDRKIEFSYPEKLAYLIPK